MRIAAEMGVNRNTFHRYIDGTAAPPDRVMAALIDLARRIDAWRAIFGAGKG